MAIDRPTQRDGAKLELGDLRSLLPYAIAFLSAAEDGEQSLYATAKTSVRRWAQEDPIDTLLTVLIGGGIAMYLAEREVNEAVVTPWDGIRVMATILSHGDASPHVESQAGRALVTIAQAFGPALAFSAFQPTAAERRAQAGAAEAHDAEALAVQRAILARLDDLVRLLETKS